MSHVRSPMRFSSTLYDLCVTSICLKTRCAIIIIYLLYLSLYLSFITTVIFLNQITKFHEYQYDMIDAERLKLFHL